MPIENWTNASDNRQKFQRAGLNVSNAGSELLQSFVNRTVQQLTLREFGLQAVLSRKEGKGQAEIINRRTALDAANGGTWVADTGTVTENAGSYAQVEFSFKTLLTKGRVTRKLQATGKTYADVLALEMAGKAEDFANSLENGILLGDSGSNANQCDGFIKLIQDVGGDQLISVAGATTANAALDLGKLDAAIDAVKGSAQRGDLVIVGSFAGIRAVNDALQAQQRFNDVTEIAAGFRVRTYDGIPLVITSEMPNDYEFAADSSIAGNAGTGTALLVMNTRYCWLSELTPTTVMPLAKTSSQYDEFDIYWDDAPVLANTKGASMLTHIETA